MFIFTNQNWFLAFCQNEDDSGSTGKSRLPEWCTIGKVGAAVAGAGAAVVAAPLVLSAAGFGAGGKCLQQKHELTFSLILFW